MEDIIMQYVFFLTTRGQYNSFDEISPHLFHLKLACSETMSNSTAVHGLNHTIRSWACKRLAVLFLLPKKDTYGNRKFVTSTSNKTTERWNGSIVTLRKT